MLNDIKTSHLVQVQVLVLTRRKTSDIMYVVDLKSSLELVL